MTTFWKLFLTECVELFCNGNKGIALCFSRRTLLFEFNAVCVECRISQSTFRYVDFNSDFTFTSRIRIYSYAINVASVVQP